MPAISFDKTRFFSEARNHLFGGFLVQGQVDGINAVLDEWAKEGREDWRECAYILATDYHETARRMQAIDEFTGDDRTYFFRMYDKDGERPSVARDLGNTEAGDGDRYHGRGLVMITGRKNYRTLGRLIGVDLEGNPELAKDLKTAVQIIFEGMLRRDSGFGDFTGAALEDYFRISPNRCEWRNARKVVNGVDRADDIAGYAKSFYACLTAAGLPSLPV